MRYCIGIDIGTGSTKAVAVSPEGKVLTTAQEAYPTLTPQPDYSEQQPDVLWQAFVKCLLDIVKTLNTKPAGVVLSSAMHSILFVDTDTRPLLNMIIWADNRGARIAERIRHSPAGEALYKQTGTPIHAMAPLSKIIWLKENQPEVFGRVHKFISIKDYFWHKLFGEYQTDYSIASAMGLFDIEALQWSSEAMALCSISTGQLSDLVPPAYTRHDLTPDAVLALPALVDVPFFIGSSDGCMANLGSFAITPGIAALTIGTSGAIRVASTTPTFNYEAMTFNYRLDDKTFISGGPINNGGYVLKWYAEIFLQKKLTTADDYAALLAGLKNSGAGADGLIFLPYILGERAPLWDSNASGTFFGIRNFHTQDHFTRAVVEGISMALYSIARAMETSGLAIKKVHVSGGFVHARQWLQLLSDIFNKEICLINPADASALGAAALGLKALGLIETYEQLLPADCVSYFPIPENQVRYQKVFAVYEKLYKNLRHEMTLVHALRDHA